MAHGTPHVSTQWRGPPKDVYTASYSRVTTPRSSLRLPRSNPSRLITIYSRLLSARRRKRRTKRRSGSGRRTKRSWRLGQPKQRSSSRNRRVGRNLPKSPRKRVSILRELQGRVYSRPPIIHSVVVRFSALFYICRFTNSISFSWGYRKR